MSELDQLKAKKEDYKAKIAALQDRIEYLQEMDRATSSHFRERYAAFQDDPRALASIQRKWDQSTAEYKLKIGNQKAEKQMWENGLRDVESKIRQSQP